MADEALMSNLKPETEAALRAAWREIDTINTKGLIGCEASLAALESRVVAFISAWDDFHAGAPAFTTNEHRRLRLDSAVLALKQRNDT
jgi:hypothetical protein